MMRLERARDSGLPAWVTVLLLVFVGALLLYKGYVLFFKNPDMRTEDMEKEKRKLWRLFR